MSLWWYCEKELCGSLVICLVGELLSLVVVLFGDLFAERGDVCWFIGCGGVDVGCVMV